MLECGHPADEVVRALASLATSFDLAQQNHPKWQQHSRRARELCPHICDEVVRGRRTGTIPDPNSSGWDDYVSRRTGLSRAEREHVFRMVRRRNRKELPSPPPRPVTPTPKATDPAHSENLPLAGWTHRDLAVRWRAVDARDISTDVLVILLGVPHQQVAHYAAHLGDILTAPPWRVRVRGRGVDGKQLQERVDDILRAPRKT